MREPAREFSVLLPYRDYVTQRYPKTKTNMLVISSVVIPPSPTSQRSLNQAAAVPLNMSSRSAGENPATIS